MKVVLAILKGVLWWICLPLVLAVTFVVAPCYTLGEIGWSGTWCGYKGAPPHREAQFWTGLAVGLLIAFYAQKKHRRSAAA